MAFSFMQYLNPDGTPKEGTNLKQPINVGQQAMVGGDGMPVNQPGTLTSPAAGTWTSDQGSGRFGYDAKPIFDKYTSQIDYSAPDALDQLEAAMRRDGIQVERRGDLFKIPGTDAGFVDILQNKAFVEGRGPVRGWAYQPFYGSEDFDRLTAMGRNPHTGEMALPGQQFSRDQDAPISGPGALPGYSLTGVNNLASFQAPGLNAPWTEQFQAPSTTDNPGWEWAKKEAMGAMQNSAAANGTLLTRGFQKDLAGEITGMALQDYGNAWNRAFDKYSMDRGTFWGNQQNAKSGLGDLSRMGLAAASNYAPAQGNLVMGQGNANAAEGLARTQRGNDQIGNVISAAPSVWDAITQARRG